MGVIEDDILGGIPSVSHLGEITIKQEPQRSGGTSRMYPWEDTDAGTSVQSLHGSEMDGIYEGKEVGGAVAK